VLVSSAWCQALLSFDHTAVETLKLPSSTLESFLHAAPPVLLSGSQSSPSLVAPPPADPSSRASIPHTVLTKRRYVKSGIFRRKKDDSS